MHIQEKCAVGCWIIQDVYKLILIQEILQDKLTSKESLFKLFNTYLTDYLLKHAFVEFFE